MSGFYVIVTKDVQKKKPDAFPSFGDSGRVLKVRAESRLVFATDDPEKARDNAHTAARTLRAVGQEWEGRVWLLDRHGHNYTPPFGLAPLATEKASTSTPNPAINPTEETPARDR